MSTAKQNDLPKLSDIRTAILAARPQPIGFPLQSLRDPKTVEEIRHAPYLQGFLRDMREEAQRAQSTAPEPLSFNLFHLFEATGDRAEFERVYFDRRRRLLGLSLATVIDETDEYLPALSNLIWELCNEYTWSLPAHLPIGVEMIKDYRVPPDQVVDLFAAHTAHALAEVHNLLGDRLDPWLHYRIVNEIERRIFQPIFYDPHHFEWESELTNWAAVCGGCVGMAALILEQNRERLVGMIDRVIRTMDCFLDGFGADGGCPEGIAYWVYGFGFYTYFAEMLRAFTDGTLNLLLNERIQRIAAFPQVVSLGNGRFVNFSDSSEHVVVHPGLGSRLMNGLNLSIPDLNVPDFHSDRCYRWGHITRDLLWTDPMLLRKPVTDGSFYLDDLAWVVDRRAVDGINVAFAAKGGHNDEPHNHNDLGHFILHLGGESILADLGAGVYTRQYFGAERYGSLHTGSQGHSLPLINDQTQRAGLEHAAKVLDYETRANGVGFVLDLTCAYSDANLQSFLRTFDWAVDGSQGTLRLIDTFEFGRDPALVEECFVSLTPPQIGEGTARWEGQAGLVTLAFDAERFAAAVDSLETKTHYSESTTIYRLHLYPKKNMLSRREIFVIVCISRNQTL